MHPPKCPMLRMLYPFGQASPVTSSFTNIAVDPTRRLFSDDVGGGGGKCGYLMVDFLSTPGWSHGEYPSLAPRY